MLLILAAAPLETSLLRRQLGNPTAVPLHSYRLSKGQLCGLPVLIAHGGIGPSSMAMQLTRLLERQRPEAVLLCGCGGSFPRSGLRNGDLAIASTECFGDLGVAADSFIPLQSLDIPERPELAPPCRQNFDLHSPLTELACQLLPQARFGPFVTVSCCSGTPALSAELEGRTGAICENMEGAAAALVCAEYGVPLLELRGISNPTGTRDPQQWELRLGADVAQQALLQLLRYWPAGGIGCAP